MKHRFILSLITQFLLHHAISQTTIEGSMLSGGITRAYRLYVPAMYDGSEAVPLVLNLHGYTSNAFEQELYGDFRPIADTANFLIVHPDGTLDESGEQFWNSFGATGVDDVAFLSALIDTISAAYNIDADCVYSTGMSNGGFMSYELACQLSNRIAAIASVTGSMTLLQTLACNAQHPTPVMQIHGTSDGTVAYNGSFGVYAIDDLVSYWAEYNNCSMTPTITDVPDINTGDGCTAEHHVYGGGDQETTVELFKVLGGDHTWPGAFFNISTTNMDFSASLEIWKFFSRYKLDALSHTSETEKSGELLLFPNPSDGKVSIRFADDALRTITITNLQGQCVKELTVNNELVVLNIDIPGLYIVTAKHEQLMGVHRLIVE